MWDQIWLFVFWSGPAPACSSLFKGGHSSELLKAATCISPVRGPLLQTEVFAQFIDIRLQPR